LVLILSLLAVAVLDQLENLRDRKQVVMEPTLHSLDKLLQLVVEVVDSMLVLVLLVVLVAVVDFSLVAVHMLVDLQLQGKETLEVLVELLHIQVAVVVAQVLLATQLPVIMEVMVVLD
jgi:hypothetical protein